MTDILDFVASLSAWFVLLPRWVFLSIYGVMLTYIIAAGGYTLARTGIKPLWVLLLLVPTLNVVALWLWAYGAWPREKAKV